MEELLIIAIVLIFVYLFYYKPEGSKNKNISNFCDKYGICTKVDSKIKNEFDEIKKKLLDFYNNLITAMERDYPNDLRTKRLKRGFKMNNVYQVFPNNSDGDTSFTINKGEEMGLCVRSGEDISKLENIEIIKFVFAHELSHIMCLSHNHTDEYWQGFKWLLKIAKDNNLMNVKNYNRYAENYCSLHVNYSPFYDDLVPLK